jgi:Ca2+-binding EF-hand superfamily protein
MLFMKKVFNELSEEERLALNAAFSAVDLNKDGYVDSEELAEMFILLGFEKGTELNNKIDEVFYVYDQDLSNVLDEQKWTAVMCVLIFLA